MKNYCQKEIETASRDEIVSIQSKKIVKQVQHVYENVPYYRNVMDTQNAEDYLNAKEIATLQYSDLQNLLEVKQ